MELWNFKAEVAIMLLTTTVNKARFKPDFFAWCVSTLGPGEFAGDFMGSR